MPTSNSQTLPRYGLMLGNFATGLCILAPAGMLTVLADGLSVGIRETGLLGRELINERGWAAKVCCTQ